MSQAVVPDVAEQAVLGSMLIEPAAAGRAKLELEVDDFYSEKHQHIYRAACELFDEQTPIDGVTVLERLRLRGRAAAAGGNDTIMACINAVGTAAHVLYYAKIVRAASLQRQFDRQLQVTAQEQTPEHVEELSAILGAISGHGMGRIVSFKDDLVDMVEEILSRPVVGYQTGFFSLDNFLVRLEPGDVVSIGARTSGGKTAMMTQMLMNMARAGVPVAYMTSEMDEKQLIKRILPAAAGVGAYHFRSGNMGEMEKEAVRRAVSEELVNLPIHIVGRPRLSLRDVRGTIVKTGCKFLAYDYLQRAQMPKAESRVYEIEHFMIGLKTIAQETGCVIALGVQLDRGMDRNPTIPPTLADLRGSGAIEHESDQVILLWRPPAAVIQKRGNDWTPPRDGCMAIEALILKNRHGEAGAVADLELNGEMVSMAERTMNPRSGDKKQEGEWWQ